MFSTIATLVHNGRFKTNPITSHERRHLHAQYRLDLGIVFCSLQATELPIGPGVAPACRALGVSRATFYRRQRPVSEHQQPRPTPARRCVKPSVSTSSMCSPPPALLTAHRATWWQRFSMRASTYALSARCIECWLPVRRCESVVINVSIRHTPSLSTCFGRRIELAGLNGTIPSTGRPRGRTRHKLCPPEGSIWSIRPGSSAG